MMWAARGRAQGPVRDVPIVISGAGCAGYGRAMRHAPLLATAALAATCLAPAPAVAQGIDTEDVVRAELRPGWRTGAGTQMAALHIRLAPDWMTYWRKPGIAGIAPRFDWSDSSNLAHAEPHWPRPEVFDQEGYRSIGYGGELVLPLEITPQGRGPIEARLTLDIGVCREICIPVTLELAAPMPELERPDPLIEAALARRPVDAAAGQVGDHACEIVPGDDALNVTARIDMPVLEGTEVAVFEYRDEAVALSESVTRREGGRLVAQAKARSLGGRPAALERSDLRITVLGASDAVEIQGCPRGD